MARTPLVAGNWKMHGSREFTADLLTALKAAEPWRTDREVLVCPPFVLLPLAAEVLSGCEIRLGAQNLSEHIQGAYTGEVGGSMLRDYGCRYVIVGHSERRTLFSESDQQVAAKFERAQSERLIPILCVGESSEERDSGATEAVVRRQLDAVLARTGIAAFSNAVVAYEPIWAIGTGRTASPEQAQQVHAFIRSQIGSHDDGVAAALRIIYGGSVKAANAAEIFAQADVDGGLIGGAALKAEEFIAICDSAG
jgi:triosephosphate isomerase